MQSLPTDVLEASVDGANGTQTMFKIIIPLMMPSITVCSFLCVTNGFKLYDQNLALTNGAPSNMSEGLAMNITRTFYGRWAGKASAKRRQCCSSFWWPSWRSSRTSSPRSKEVEA